MRIRAIFFSALMVGVIGIFLAGCATGQSGSSASASQSDLLKQAGFGAHTAQDAHVAYIQTLPAKKVVMNNYQGKTLYLVCTDPASKQCYLGDKAAYDRYQQLATQQAISEDQRNVQEQRWDPEAQQMWVDMHGGG